MKRLRPLLLLLPLLAACAPGGGSDTAFQVRLHPDGPLYAGDIISFEIIPPADFQNEGQEASVSLGGQELGRAAFDLYGIGQRLQATLWWAWDTHDMAPGDHSLTFTILPEGYTWEETVRLLPSGRMPQVEAMAEWVTTETDCCSIHYISGTEAERDLGTLTQMVERLVQEAEDDLDSSFQGRPSITFLPRVLGQGGFASDGIYISYLDGNYAASSIELTLQHEIIHILDAQLGGGDRPPLFLEGLAVHLCGGHYQPESILTLAAALPGLDLYIPLSDLAQDFYFHQHEAGYLEAAALVGFMIQRFGWDEFDSFYRDIHSGGDGGMTGAIDSALRSHFNLGLQELEQGFLEHLNSQDHSAEVSRELSMTVAYYDSMRRYQELLDPSAYFLSAWMPLTDAMQERGIEADYLRHPSGIWNQAVVTLLLNALDDLMEGNYMRVERDVKFIETVLDFMQ